MRNAEQTDSNAHAGDSHIDWGPSSGDRIRQSAAKALSKGAETTRQWSDRAQGRAARGLGDVSEGLDKASAFLANRDVAELKREALAWADRNPERALAVAAAAGL